MATQRPGTCVLWGRRGEFHAGRSSAHAHLLPERRRVAGHCARAREVRPLSLVVFLHGQPRFGAPEQFRAWNLLPAQLARSGYVVAIPELAAGDPWAEGNPDVPLVVQVLIWMHSSWQHASVLLPLPATAIVGHSFGALLGARVARQLHGGPFEVAAYVSLSGVWRWWQDTLLPPPLDLEVPTLFTWGTGLSVEVNANLTGAYAHWWQQSSGAKHKIVFTDGEHWDYVPDEYAPGAIRGPCWLVGSLAADFVTTFLSHYVPPERWWLLSEIIPHSLIPPPLDLTPNQELFVGGHLGGLSEIASAVGCSVTHTWKISPMEQGDLTLSGPPAS